MLLGRTHTASFPKVSRCFKRTVIIPPPSRDGVHRGRKAQTKRHANMLDLDNIDFRNEREVQFKINQLRQFAKDLRQLINHTDELKRKENVDTELSSTKRSGRSDIESDSILILDALNKQPSEKGVSNNLSNFLLSSSKVESLLNTRLAERIDNQEVIVKSLFDERNRDWNSIVDALYNSEDRLKGLGMNFIKKNITQVFKGLSYSRIEKIDEMIMESVQGDVSKIKPDTYEWLLLSISRLSIQPTDSATISGKLRELVSRMDQTIERRKFQPTQYMLSACIVLATKLKSWEDMEFCLKKFRDDYSLQPNKQNYTTVISFYASLNQYKKAWKLFDAMKFLSLEHMPDTKTYNQVLELCQKERNYAKSLDLLQEMKDLKVKPNVQSYLNVAKCLAFSSADQIVSEGKADSLRLNGWKLIHDIQSKPELSVQLRLPSNSMSLLETMLCLAAYDGDVGLSRAIYYKYTNSLFKKNLYDFKKCNGDSKPVDYVLIWKDSLSPKMFNWLLMAYSKFNKSRLPLLLGYNEGTLLRRNFINSVDYLGRHGSMDGSDIRLPMLPLGDMHDPNLILSESRALWQFNLEYGGTYDLRRSPDGLESVSDIEKLIQDSENTDFFKLEIASRIMKWKSKFVNSALLNPITMVTFLSIPIRLKEPTEFKLRLKEFTFQSFDLQSMVEKEFMSLKALQPAMLEMPEATSVEKPIPKATDFIMYLISMKHKILRTVEMYELSMKAAISFHDYDLAMQTWEDRGKFRLTDAFQNLPPSQRQESDARFAQLMLEYFTNEKMYQDALSIVFSSLKTIEWTYPMVKGLHKGLLSIEDVASASKLIDIVNKKSKLKELDEEIKALDI